MQIQQRKPPCRCGSGYYFSITRIDWVIDRLWRITSSFLSVLAAFCQKFQQSSTPPFFSNHHGNGRPPPSTNTADTRRAGRDIVAKQVSAPTAHSRRKEGLTRPAFTRSAALGDVSNIYSLFAEARRTGKGKGGWSQRRRRRASETNVGAHTGRRDGPIAEERTARDGGETGAGDYVALPASRATKGGAVWWGVENFRLVLTSECFCDGAGVRTRPQSAGIRQESPPSEMPSL